MMTAATEAGASTAADALEYGLALLDEQRDAMLARDTARLEAANARLATWITACREASTHSGVAANAPSAQSDPGLAGRLRAIRTALDANSTLARRSALQASRGLDALIAPESRTYTDEGLTRGPSVRRETLSA